MERGIDSSVGSASYPAAPRCAPAAGRIRRRRGARGEHGAAAVMTAILLPTLYIIGLLAVNWAVAVAAHISAQRAADAAVFAGCMELPNQSKAETAATKYGSSGGGLNADTGLNLESGQGDQTVTPTVDSTGAVSQRTGAPLQNDRIAVNVSRTQWLFGVPNHPPIDRTINVSAGAVCTRDEGSLSVLIALKGCTTTGGACTATYPCQDSFKVQGVQLDLGRGGVTVDCQDATHAGLSVQGNGSITARWIATGSGTWFCNSTCTFTDPAGNPATPTQETQPDPYVAVAEPALGSSVTTAPPTTTTNLPIPPDNTTYADMSGCDYGSATHTTRFNTARCVFTSDAAVAQPGVYWGGLTLGDGTTKTITLAPGMYYMAAGGLDIRQNTTVIVQGGGSVVFFNGPNPYGKNNTDKKCGALLIEDNTKLLVAPPTSGPYAGLLFFQSRDTADCNDSSSIAKVFSGVTIGLTSGPFGAIYLPMGDINIGPQSQGQSGTLNSMNMIIVANTISLTGPVSFNNVYIPSGDVRHGQTHLVE